MKLVFLSFFLSFFLCWLPGFVNSRARYFIINAELSETAHPLPADWSLTAPRVAITKSHPDCLISLSIIFKTAATSNKEIYLLHKRIWKNEPIKKINNNKRRKRARNYQPRLIDGRFITSISCWISAVWTRKQQQKNIHWYGTSAKLSLSSQLHQIHIFELLI